MSDVQVFNFQHQAIRTSEKDGQTWFVLKDVCKALEIQNPTDILNRLDEDERTRLNLGRQGEANIINESGLYALILRSNKPNARPFRKWVTSVVLPSIRCTGSYNVAKAGDNDVIKNRYIALLEKHNDLLIDMHLYKEQLRNARSFRPVTTTERGRIKELAELGYSIGEIAQDTGRSKTTVKKYKNIEGAML